ncbi:MAG: RHS repeat-associated core domain-containing protein [Candidatus Edwardsbacteria bacterium]
MEFPRFQKSESEKHYYHHDGLGSTVGLTDINGSVVQSYIYDEFGNLLSAYGVVPNAYLYTGQEWDVSPLNAYNLRAREYYPQVGRFGSEDPVRGNVFSPQSYNYYLYVENNPVNSMDPLGLVGCSRDEVGRELSLIKSVYYECHNEIKWRWGPWENVKWCTNWATGVPGHSCGQFVSEYMGCIYKKLGSRMRCCQLEFKSLLIHAWIGIKCKTDDCKTITDWLDPWSKIWW